MKIQGLYTLIILLFLPVIHLQAQDRCGSVEYMNKLEHVESKEVFENWMQQKRALLPNSGLKSFGEEQTTVYQIPVVVHVIHNGESVGSGSNISDAQIFSQIEVLNEDFRRLNADSVNIPDQFKSLYSDIGFEFVLAKRDPNNQSTNGITRTDGGKTIWFESQDAEIKSLSYWPSEDYLNIWVLNLSGYLGYAQYPQSSTLDGLMAPYNAETDGVVIAYNAFGSIEIDPDANLQSDFNLGRTTTHEIGHYFGLRHIWGDGGCGFDDYVDDTPLAEDNYYGCPSLGPLSTTCGSQDMFMNYMDYVNDDCMNLFTVGQKERMLVVMENSPRRLSLTTSPGLIPPDCEDIALVDFVSPDNGVCSDTVSPVLSIQNVGYCTVSSVELSLSMNGIEVESKTFAINLNVNQTTDVAFDPIPLSTYGNIVFSASIVSVNGVDDSFTGNNSISKTTLHSESTTLLNEDFTISNPQWTVRTNQQVSQWDVDESLAYSDTNTAGVFKYYKNNGNTDSYVSPKLTMDANPKTLLFDYAYGYREGLDDKLVVVASTDCGSNFADTLFLGSGNDLATEYTPVAYYTSGPLDWRQKQIDLTNYANMEVIFAFIGVSNGGNRIYLDNIHVVDNNSYSDIALVGFNQPALVCSQNNEAGFFIENKGTIPVNSLNLKAVQGLTTTTVNYTQLDLSPGERMEIAIPVVDFNNSTDIEVSLVDADSNSDNNSCTQTLTKTSEAVSIPFREKFNGSELPENWAISSRGTDQNKGWALENNQLKWNAFESPAKGLKESIILPALNLSNVTSASMHFDWSYAYNVSDEELLRVKVSTDCGSTYETIFEEGGDDLSTIFSSTPWLPGTDDDWVNKYIDLSSYAGMSNVVVVLELMGAQGNNAYVDNIELFASNIVEPLVLDDNTVAVYPNPVSSDYVHFTLNLVEQQSVEMLIYTSNGSVIYKKPVENGLNQTFDIPTAPLNNGLYVVRIVGDQFDLRKSFMINR